MTNSFRNQDVIKFFFAGYLCGDIIPALLRIPGPRNNAGLDRRGKENPVNGFTGIYNGRDINSPQQADVCVIGGGPAGVTAAWKLAETGLTVILLDGSRQLNYPAADSTNQDYYQQSWPDKKNLYNGVATGIFATNEPQFLILPTSPYPPSPWERERVYGGTPVHGGGQCRAQDPIDIEGREPFFPRWPISYAELNGFYREASVSNHLSGNYPDNFTTAFWQTQLGLTGPIQNLPGFDVEMYQFMGAPPKGKWKNFAIRPWGQSQQTIDHFARVIVNASVLNIAATGGSVAALEVASMEDYYPSQPMKPDNPKVATRFVVRASVYILACGAVENARQLLLSGIGNPKMVGHYFMCHPFSDWSPPMITTNRSYLSPDQYNLMAGKDKQGIQWYDPSFNNTIEGRFITNPQTTRAKGIGRCWFWANQEGGSAPMYMEMAPNYESYVALDDNGPRDPIFGQKQTRINWSLADIDRRTYEENCKEFQANVGGAIAYPTWAQMSRKWIVNGHHMGTTRMSVNPNEGVVDPNLKVHGLSNLFVAGSSVFPTGGISNPTFTIVALSLRLASHIRGK